MFFNFLKNNNNFWPEKNSKIIVAVSGGVDSSVALALLKEEGYEVEGVFFRKFNPDKEKCQQEREDARKVCEHLGVPFHFLDLEEEYKEKILEYFIDSYRRGKTPNPDMLCNKFIKFGAFLEFAEKQGADYIATGHYARKSQKSRPHFFAFAPQANSAQRKKTKPTFFLQKAVDKNKDQTYFLAMLSQEQLAKSVFPLGDLKKSQVRKLAKKFGLLTAEKKDSQGICFLGKKVKLADFLKKYIPEQTGDLLNKKGEVIGQHKGVPFYTIGQRYGFEISPEFTTTDQKRLFVVNKDAKNNTITVDDQHLSRKKIIIKNVSWISGQPDFSKIFEGRIRYRGKLIKTSVKKITGEKLELNFIQPHTAISSGQFVVLYDKNICLGAGEIT